MILKINLVLYFILSKINNLIKPRINRRLGEGWKLQRVILLKLDLN